MAPGPNGSAGTPDKSQEVVDHVVTTKPDLLTELQKVELKAKTQDIIALITADKIADFKSQVIIELSKHKEDVDGLQTPEIGESVNKAKENTLTAPSAPINPAVTAIVSEERAGEIQETIKKVSGLPRFWAKLSYMIAAFLNGNELSFEQDEVYKADILPGLSDIGITIPKEDSKTEKIVVDKLMSLGIPLNMSKAFFSFIKDPAAQKENLPKNFQAVFEAGRINYQDLKSTDRINPDPAMAIQQVLTFEITNAPAEPTPQETAPVSPVAIELIKINIGGKEVSVEASPESIAIFKKIQKSAETILGRDKVNMEKTLKDAYEANTETDPKKKGEAVLKSVAIEIAKQIRDATAILSGAKIEKVAKDGKETSLADDSFTGDLLPAIDAKLQAYIPLAFKDLSTRVFDAVNTKLEELKRKIVGLSDADYKKIQETIQKSIIGSFIEVGQVNAAPFIERTKTGYDEVMRDILKQAEKLQAIKVAEFNPTVLKIFQEKSPLELS